jgi:predicted Zn-dependent protease
VLFQEQPERMLALEEGFSKQAEPGCCDEARLACHEGDAGRIPPTQLHGAEWGWPTGVQPGKCAAMKTLFEAVGYRLGKAAAKAKNLVDLAGGGDEESLRAEIRLGRDLAAAMLERVHLVEENRLTRFAAEVGQWLAANLKEKRMPFTFRVIAEQGLNAFALPGGHVFVTAPMLEACEGQRDEIAFVLGHEMAHIVLRHAVERIVRDSALSLLLGRVSGKHAVGAWLGRVGQQALSRAYSRQDELEADSFAVSLIRTSGGDALAGEHLLERLARLMSNQSAALLGEYFATRPSLTERLAHLRFRRSGEPASSSTPLTGSGEG